MKRLLSLLLGLSLITLSGCSSQTTETREIKEVEADNELIQTILNSYSAKELVAGEVEDDVVELVLYAGTLAPSARNDQPWHFVVLNQYDAVSSYASDAVEGAVGIIACYDTSSDTGVTDTAFALQNMYLAAQGLGLGAHIYTSPVSKIEQNLADYDVPDGYTPMAYLLIGCVEDSTNALSSASPRNDVDSVTTFP